MLNKLLLRQIEKHLGKLDEIPTGYLPVLEVVSESYNHYEKDCKMLERSIELSSAEMIELNNKLRKETEELKKAHVELKRIFESINEGFYSMDMISNKYINLSAAHEKIYGYSLGEFFADTRLWYDVILPEDRIIIDRNCEKVFHGEQIIQQFRILHKNQSIRWLESTMIPTVNDSGKLLRIDGIVTDITEKKMAEEILQKSEANLKTIFENTDTSHILLDVHMNIVMFNELVNDGFLKEMMGPLKAGNNLISHIPEKLKPDVSARLRQVLTGEQICYETESPLINGVLSWYDVRMSPIMDTNKNVHGIIIAISDITNRKIAESEKEKMTSDLAQRNKDLEQFAYIVSHNLRGPMANILGLSYLLSDEQITEENKKPVLHGLTSSVEKLDGVVRDLNSILQIRKGINEKKVKVCISELINDIIASNGTMLKNDSIVIKTDLEKVREMLTLKSYLYSIFYNLISNSVKYRQQDMKLLIEILARRVNDKVEFVYKDNGMGIDLSKNRDHVFGLYKRFHPEIAEGKGMGLFMIKTHVEAIGGKINIESEVNKGTEFKIEFETA